MKKKIAALLLGGALTLSLCACDSRDGYNVEVNHRKYADVSDQMAVNTYNGYTCGDYSIVHNDDGTYTVTIQVNPSPKNRS